MFYARVEEYKLVSVRSEWEVFVFKSLAVEPYKLSFLAEAGSELVHDAAVDPAIVVLSGLADTGEFELVYAVVEKIVDGVGETAF